MPNPVDMNDLGHTSYEVDGAIGIVTIDRADKANAVNQQTLDEMDACFRAAEEDRDVRVIVLRANGKHFSSGHDMTGSNEAIGENADPEKAKGSSDLDWEERGLQAIFEWERIHYLGYSRRWRDIPKPTIAAVQGACIAGGLMLCWPMDLIIAADNAHFSDPVLRMGIGGVEYHGHTWEVGPRKAKEMLFTARRFPAEEADELDSQTMELAREIAEMHPFALTQAKRIVNQTQDVQGFYSALQSGFDMHTVGHGNAMTINGYPVLVNLDQMKQQNG